MLAMCRLFAFWLCSDLFHVLSAVSAHGRAAFCVVVQCPYYIGFARWALILVSNFAFLLFAFLLLSFEQERGVELCALVAFAGGTGYVVNLTPILMRGRLATPVAPSGADFLKRNVRLFLERPDGQSGRTEEKILCQNIFAFGLGILSEHQPCKHIFVFSEQVDVDAFVSTLTFAGSFAGYLDVEFHRFRSSHSRCNLFLGLLPKRCLFQALPERRYPSSSLDWPALLEFARHLPQSFKDHPC